MKHQHPPALVLSDITYSYEPDVYAVQHVSFAIQPGSYTVILGHNGSGKSTLAKIMMGLIAPQEGTVTINGTVLKRETLAELRHQIGIVFQNPDNQFIGATVEDDIAFGLENQCVPAPEMGPIIQHFAEQVGMSAFMQKEPSHLSGGQKQRVAIAGVLAMAPSIVIFDEATSMLDPKGRDEIRQLILKMRELHPNLTLISITHDIDEALLADEVIVMNQGVVYASGKPRDILIDEDALTAIQLQAPFAVQLSHQLQQAGFSIPTQFTMKESIDALWPLFLTK